MHILASKKIYNLGQNCEETFFHVDFCEGLLLQTEFFLREMEIYA